MTTTIVLLIVGVVVLLYRQANIKRRKLRAQARQQYHDIMISITYWAEERDNPERFQLAQLALGMYDQWHKRSTFLPIYAKDVTPEEFELLDEWRKLIQQAESKCKTAWSSRPSDLLELRFMENRADLRAYCSELNRDSKQDLG